MPILYIHGVATRSTNFFQDSQWNGIKSFLRTYVAPVISASPGDVLIEPVYWGDVASGLAWNGASYPPAIAFTAVPKSKISRRVVECLGS
jgi:hypothetical protein